MRELGGQMHLFAHNGGLQGIWDKLKLESTAFRPVGETDSEHAFCYLLGRLAPLWHRHDGPPPVAERFAAIAETAGELARLGNANFLYSDSDVHFSEPRAPGLSYSRRQDLAVPGLHAVASHDDTEAIYVASVPLTASGWKPLPESTLVALRSGLLVAQTGTGSGQ
jgi:glutamine amidotransferase